MPNRKNNTGLYRYGFQGQENDNEIKGDGNSVNYKYRMHDPRLGRFFTTDPLTAKYPWNSSYAFSENRVLDGVEWQGLEWRNAKGQLVYDKEKGEYTEFATEQDKAIGNGLKNSGFRGSEQFKFLVGSKTEIRVEFSSGIQTMMMGETKSYTLGNTPDERLEFTINDEGKVVSVEKAKIDVFVGTAEEFVSDINNNILKASDLDEGSRQRGNITNILEGKLSYLDVVIATLAHEIDHVKIGNVRQREKESDGIPRVGKFKTELVPQMTENEVIKDLRKEKELNTKKGEDEK